MMRELVWLIAGAPVEFMGYTESDFQEAKEYATICNGLLLQVRGSLLCCHKIARHAFLSLLAEV